MKKLDYQEKAISKLIQSSNELLSLSGHHSIVFKSPTGSGKTIMLAEFLQRFIKNRNDNKQFAFIWAAPRKLHEQSRSSLASHYASSLSIKCSFFGDLLNKSITSNEILFLNWESINKKGNIYYRENEQEFYLEKIIENTKNNLLKLILIIDESHHTAGSENSKGLMDMISPDLSILVSATPVNIQYDDSVIVHRQHVIEEGMIKKFISINPDFKNIISSTPSGGLKLTGDAQESTDEFIVKQALLKREYLLNLFKTLSVDINPLLLIQLPDKMGKEDVFLTKIVSILKKRHQIDTDNGRLAIYLDKDKTNLAAIEKNNSSVDVMIFKQAISLGWDCPRAHVLALFRNWSSVVFSVQTVGRIMRMPERKHYEIEDLNIGYIFSNSGEIEIHEDITDGYSTVFQSKRNEEIYENQNLLSCHSLRQRARTRLSPLFVTIFLRIAKELKLKDKISTTVSLIDTNLITDFELTDLEDSGNEKRETVDRELNEEEIQNEFDKFSINALSPFFPEERSIKRINKSIYEFFKVSFPNKFAYSGKDIQIIVLHKENKQHFLDAINLAKEKYSNQLKNITKKLVFNEQWEIPKIIYYSNDFSIKNYSLSIMQPFYENNNCSQIEKDFALYLESNNKKIKWWFKNGDRDGTSFAVPRKQGNDNVPFYVDWIVCFDDGSLGLFDTKGGITAETAGSRALGLYEYIDKEVKKGKNIFGGIIIQKDQSFWLNSSENYHYDPSNLLDSGWVLF